MQPQLAATAPTAPLLANYPEHQTRTVLGLISGTSADGVDVAQVDFVPEPEGLRLVVKSFHTVAYPAPLKARVLEASQDKLSLRQAAVLHTDLGEFFAEVALSAVPSTGCALIGSHGQTVCHLPESHTTLQLGDGSIIANRTGVTTISDFRTADMALGGQGAPLVPVFDAFLLAHSSRFRVAVNLGGIANITVVAPAGASITAWDTGPANCVSDALCRLHERGDYDPDGQAAARGTVDLVLLQRVLATPYFALTPPKSTGLEDFGSHFAAEWFGEGTFEDQLRTALAVSAQSLVDSIVYAVGAHPEGTLDIVFAGGGTSNRTLMQEIERRLKEACRLRGWPDAHMGSFQEFGVPEDAREAVAFAYLADLTARGCPGTLPSTTGTRHPAVLGKVSFPYAKRQC